MAKEIERKFLVKGDFSGFVTQKNRVVQGYLCAEPDRTVRVRIYGEKAFLTIKGQANKSGLTRNEFEYEIPVVDADELLNLCKSGIIDKIRHIIPFKGHIWEVDFFMGENAGLILAEIELEHESEQFFLPEWLGEEVTGQIEYYNAMLSKHPYKDWV